MSDPIHRASKVTDSTIKRGISCSGGNSNRRKPKKTRFQIQQVINEIGKMLSTGKPDREIMEQIQIKRSQYYEYKSKLFQQSAELFDRFNDENRDSLIYQKEMLSERLTRLYNLAELELSQNTSPQGGNSRASIYLAAQNIAINIFKLEIEGVRVLADGQARQMRDPSTYNQGRGTDRTSIQKETGIETFASNSQNTEYDESEIY
jgi:hypothetical protein